MLNKLLKKCMPWMDKGRWHSITVLKSDHSFRTVFNGDEILSAEITSNNSIMTVTTKHAPHIIDFKFCPENNAGYTVLPSLDIVSVDENVFNVPIRGMGTYWFFMR